MIISCIGDVNVGKSCLISQILINCGLIKKRDINKEYSLNNKNWLANIVDSDKNEQSRGMTLFSSYENFMINNNEYIIINNPGHNYLLKDIIISTSIADIAILLISANPSETDKNIINGSNYSIISRVNGIDQIIVCISKCEYINNNNSYNNIIDNINKSLKNQHFNKIYYIPCSAKKKKYQ